jgi:hypothetical protein
MAQLSSGSAVTLGIDIQSGQPVLLEQKQRLRGFYGIGIPGSGKTTLAINMILQDIRQGMGVCSIDIHGDATNAILARIPLNRVNDVILFNPFDENYAPGLNPYQCRNLKDSKERSRTVSYVMQIFAKLFTRSGDFSETPQMAQVLRNTAYTLLDNPGMTMAEIPLLLNNEDARTRLVGNVTNAQVRGFWEHVYDRMKPQEQREYTSSTVNKLDTFLINEITSLIVGQSTTTLDFRQIMDNGKILLVQLDAELVDVTKLLGSIIVGQLLNAALSRKDIPEDQRQQCNLYADEYQNFATPDFAKLLAEARKFGLGTHIFHQNLEQLDEENKGAALLAPNKVFFSVSGKNAEELKYELEPKPEPGNLQYEQIYEPEIIKSTKEVVTWEPPKAEQTYNQVDEELAELQAEFRDFELIKALGLALLHLVFGQKGTNKNLSSLKDIHILCNPDFQDITIATCQKVIPAGSAAIERKTRLPELYKKRSKIEEDQSKLKRNIWKLEAASSWFPTLDFFTDDLWKKPFKKGFDRDMDKLIQQLRECEEEITAELEADRRNDNGYQYIIPATTLTPIEKNIDCLLHADDDFFVRLKGLFLPPHTFTVLKEKEEKEKHENFFDRYIAFLPSMLQLFTHPLPEMEVITATSPRKIPLTKREKTEITKFVQYLKLQIDMLLDRRDEAFVFIPQKGFEFIYPYGSSRDMADAKIYKHPDLEDGTPYFSLHVPDYNPSNGWNEMCAQGRRFYQQRESLDQERYTYLQNHYGYWHIHEHPEIPAFFDAEIHRFSDITFPKQNELQSLEKRHDDLLRCKKITTEEVIEYKALSLNTGEVISPYYIQKYEKELKVSIGFSEGESIGRGKSESHGQSISFSEGNINLYQGVASNDEPFSNARDRNAVELTKQPQFTAMIKIAGTDGSPVERAIKILKLEPELVDSAALQKRIERIREQNIQDGYYRLRDDVEIEIAARQKVLAEPIQKHAKAKTGDEGKLSPEQLKMLKNLQDH